MMMTTMPSNDEHIKLMITNGGALCHTLVAYRNIVDRFFGVEARYVSFMYSIAFNAYRFLQPTFSLIRLSANESNESNVKFTLSKHTCIQCSNRFVIQPNSILGTDT